MMKKLVFLALLAACCLFSNLATAGLRPSPPQFLGGRHYLFFNVGMRLNANSLFGVSSSGISTSTNLIGTMGYGYWFADEWSFNFSASLFAPDAIAGSTGISSSVVIPMLFGLRYYPSFLALGDVGRPYLGASAGAYFWTGAHVGAGGIGAGAQTALGAQLTLGADFFITKWLTLGPSVSYHAVGDFAIGGAQRNYSGADFLLNFGICF